MVVFGWSIWIWAPCGHQQTPVRKAWLAALEGSPKLLSFSWAELLGCADTDTPEYFFQNHGFDHHTLARLLENKWWQDITILILMFYLQSWSWILKLFPPRWRGCVWTRKPSWRSTTTWSPGTPGYHFLDLGKTNGGNSRTGEDMSKFDLSSQPSDLILMSGTCTWTASRKMTAVGTCARCAANPCYRWWTLVYYVWYNVWYLVKLCT